MRTVLIVLLLAGCSDGGSGAPDLGSAADMTIPLPTIPPALALPMPQTLLLHAIGKGVQIYTCSSSTAGDGGSGYAYVFTAPDAMLLDEQMNVIGHHSAGPTWQLTDGSQIVGAVMAKLAPADPTAIPWLLLEVTMNAGTGKLATATYVHRLDTQGGVAPATGCDASTVGSTVRVDYGADYYFWGP